MFNRRYDTDTADYVIDRTQTGLPTAPSTGTIISTDGSVVAISADVVIAPATPVKVNLPGPNEPVVDSRGRMNPRWYRFLTELYTRTGGPVDNINRTAAVLGGTVMAPDALAFTGYAPTINASNIYIMPLGSAAFTGYAPTAVVA